jgi:hypothetical protein
MESKIQKKIIDIAKTAGGTVIKISVANLTGLPDLLILLPGAKILFVEVKAPGKTSRALQVYRQQQIKALGFTVLEIDDPQKFKSFIS